MHEQSLVRILLLAGVVSFMLALYDGTEGGEVRVTAKGSAVFYRNCLFPPEIAYMAISREGLSSCSAYKI